MRKSTHEIKKTFTEHLHKKFNVVDAKSWIWLRDGFLKKETQGMIYAAEEQSTLIGLDVTKFSIFASQRHFVGVIRS